MQRRHSMDGPPFMSIMLLGSTGSGKSASGNTIIGVRETFKEDFSPESVTRTCESKETELDGQTITVIDTVGLSDTPVKITDAQTQILQSTCDGVDVFLLVIKLSVTFTEENSKVVRCIQNNFGATFSKYTIVLFTHGDQLHEPIEDYLSKCETLRSVVDQCSGRYHVFNNKDEDRSQVTELLKKIESLRIKNAYKRYTGQDKETQKALLLKKCAAAAVALIGAAAVAYVGAAAGGGGGAAAGGGVVSMAAARGGARGGVDMAAARGAGGAEGGAAAIAIAGISMMGTALTAGQAALIGAAALAAAAVGAGVYFLARKYSSKEKDKSN